MVTRAKLQIIELERTVDDLQERIYLLEAKAMDLVEAVENVSDLPPIKYALKCGRLVNEIRTLCGNTLINKMGGGG